MGHVTVLYCVESHNEWGSRCISSVDTTKRSSSPPAVLLKVTPVRVMKLIQEVVEFP